ncbi:MAG TPA: hypothetical protein VMJ30_01615, partial [Gemmatimonadales bacterium]|nr:hypothetical protein [Gemmatimonadales bacterium]
RPGAGSDNWKWSASARAERPLLGGWGYLFGEYAHNSEFDGFFQFRSWLVEGAWTGGRHRPYLRYENTDRPEEERTSDPYRSPRPHLENSITGTTRWSIVTAGYGFELFPGRKYSVEPIAEVSHAAIKTIGGGIFDPEVFYGGSTFWRLAIGARLSWRMKGHRMGRYGVLDGQVAPALLPMSASHQMN